MSTPLVTGYSQIMRNLTLLRTVVAAASKESVQKAGKIVFDKVRENASLTDHHLEDLRRLGHPYARKSPKTIHVPKFMVHTRAGDLLRAVTLVTKESPKGFSFSVFLDETIAPHARFVLLGTSKMIPRDFLTGSWRQVRDEVQEIVQQDVQQNLKMFFDVQSTGL